MIKEIKITKAIRNERNELQVSFIVKEGDYTDTERVLLQNAKLHGDLLDIEFTGFEKGNDDEVIKKNRSRLDIVMKSYCEHFNESYDTILKELYKVNKIESRKELSNAKLEQLIDSYSEAIKRDIR